MSVTDRRRRERAQRHELIIAAARPAVYEAMFVLPTEVKFASDETPPELRAGFAELVAMLQPFTDPSDPRLGLRAELAWAALHGLAVLSRGGRIPPAGEAARLDLLVGQIMGAG